MVVDHIRNAGLYRGLGPGIGAALEYLARTDFGKVEIGRHDLPDGLYAMVQEYETKPREEKRWEAHRKYIDVQFVAAGSELMGYADIASLEAVGEYDGSEDVQFFSGIGDFLRLTPGVFAILYPHDAHMPGVTPSPGGEGWGEGATSSDASTVRKVVVKVPV